MLGIIVTYQRIVDYVCVGIQTENPVKVGGTSKGNSKKKTKNKTLRGTSGEHWRQHRKNKQNMMKRLM